MNYSVITPVYNRADCILRCLESVTLNIGVREDVEHIVVDDGSTDNTPEIVSQYAAAHPHIVFHVFPKNRGTNAARNKAISLARGQWCIILDSDDYWDERALETIDDTVCSHPEIRHFCFAPDDMQQSYDANPLLHGQHSVVLSFEDFLMERVGGDFVHVMLTEILRQYPFDEQLRIYEGVFFLSFYKEAQRILFTNTVVSHRERSREDSVSREFLRTDHTIVRRHIQAEELYEKRFAKDLLALDGGEELLWGHQLRLLENYLLLKDYENAKRLLLEIRRIRAHKVPLQLVLINRLHIGGLYFTALRFYLFVKYRVLKKRIK